MLITDIIDLITACCYRQIREDEPPGWFVLYAIRIIESQSDWTAIWSFHMSRFMYKAFLCIYLSGLLAGLEPIGNTNMPPVAVAAPRQASNIFMVNSTDDFPDADVAGDICPTIDHNCTLRAAIVQANFTTSPDTITVPAGVYTLTRPGVDDTDLVGDLDINAPLTIQGAGSDKTIVDGNGTITGDRVFHILSTAQQTNLSGLTIRNGVAETTTLMTDSFKGGGIQPNPVRGDRFLVCSLGCRSEFSG